MRKLTVFALLLLPAAALAEQRCEHSQQRNLQLDLAGVKTLVFDVNQHDLRIEAVSGGKGALQGRACASDAKMLDQLVVTQQKSGDKLVVTLGKDNDWSGMHWGNYYATLYVTGNVPDSLPIQLKVGSGDAEITGAPSLSADVGSGDVNIHRVRGLFTAAVGSGDVNADDIGALHVVSVGSGDVQVKRVGGASKIGKVGSGDVSVASTRGALDIGSIGSGDAVLRDIGGNVVVDSVSSGDVEANGVRGDFTVRSVGSGDVSQRNVSGRVSVPKDD